MVQEGTAMRETKRGGFSCSPLLILIYLPKLADLRQTLDHVSITAGYDIRVLTNASSPTGGKELVRPGSPLASYIGLE